MCWGGGRSGGDRKELGRAGRRQREMDGVGNLQHANISVGVDVRYLPVGLVCLLRSCTMRSASNELVICSGKKGAGLRRILVSLLLRRDFAIYFSSYAGRSKRYLQYMVERSLSWSMTSVAPLVYVVLSVSGHSLSLRGKRIQTPN